MVPHYSKYEVDNRTTESDFTGITTVSVGVEAPLPHHVTVRGSLANHESPEMDGFDLGVGADFVAGPVEISPAILYGKYESDNTKPKVEYTRLRYELGVSATL